MKKIKSVNVVIVLEGQGVVNFDGPQGALGREEFSKNNNRKFAKTVLYRTNKLGVPKSSHKLKISSNALRNAVWKEDQPFQTNHVMSSDLSRWPILIGNESSFVRGYLLTQDKLSAKRKSPVMVTDAIQTNKSVVKLETATTSGARTSTSFYEVDGIGKVTYSAKASIDVSELSFLSCDSIFDRPAFFEDQYPLLKRYFEVDSEYSLQAQPRFYSKTTSALKIAERGIVFSPELTYSLIVSTLKKILRIEFRKNTGYAAVKCIYILPTFVGDHGLDFDTTKAIKVSPSDDIEKAIANQITKENLYCAYEEAKVEDIEANKAAAAALNSQNDKKETAKAEKEKAKDQKAKEKANVEAKAEEALKAQVQKEKEAKVKAQIKPKSKKK